MCINSERDSNPQVVSLPPICLQDPIRPARAESVEPDQQQRADPMVGKRNGTATLVQRQPTRNSIPTSTNHLESEPEFNFADGYPKAEADEDDELAEWNRMDRQEVRYKNRTALCAISHIL